MTRQSLGMPNRASVVERSDIGLKIVQTQRLKELVQGNLMEKKSVATNAGSMDIKKLIA